MLKNRKFWLGILAVGLWLQLTLVGWVVWVLPVKVRDLVAEKGQEAIGKEIRVRRIALNPFRLSATIEGLTINQPEQGPPIAAVEQVCVNLSVKTVFTEGIRIQAAEVTTVLVHGRRLEDGSIDLLELIPEPEEEEEKEAMALRLDGAKIAHVSARFDDKMVGVTHVVRDLGVIIGALSTRPEDASKAITIQMAAAGGVNRAVSGMTVVVTPFAETIGVDVEGIVVGVDVTHYLPYVSLPTGLEVESAMLDLSLKKVSAAIPKGGTPELVVDGEVQITDLACNETEKGRLLEVPEITVTLSNAAPLAGDLHFGSVRIVEPKVWVARAVDESLNFLRATAASSGEVDAREDSQAPEEAGDREQAAAPEVRIRVDELDLDGLMAVVKDGAAAKRFETEVGPVIMTFRGIDTQEGAEGRASIAGSSKYCEKFSVAGSFTVSPPTLNLRLEAGPLQIAGYSPYYHNLAKIDVAGGTLEVEANASVKLEPELDLTVSGAALKVVELVLNARPDGKELARIPEFAVAGASVSTAKREAVVESVTLTKALMRAKRLADERIDWLTLLPEAGEEAEKGSGEKGEKETTSEKPFVATVKSLKVAEFAAELRDEAVEPAFATKMVVDLEVTDFSTAEGSRAKVKANVAESGGIGLEVDAGVQATPLAAEALVKLVGLEPGRFVAYYGEMINFEIVSGTVGATAMLYLPEAGAGEAVVKNSDVEIADLKLRAKGEEAPFLAIDSLKAGASIDAGKKTATGVVTLKGGFANAVRKADGSIDLAAILAPVKTEATASEQAEKPEAAEDSAGSQWQAMIDRVDLSEFDLGFRDETTPTPVELKLEDIKVGLDRFGTMAGVPPAKLELNTRLASGGTISVVGDVEPAGKKVALETKLVDVGVQAFEPYIRNQLNVLLKAGTFSTTGRLEADASGESPRVSWKGELGIAKFAMIDPTNAEPLVQWDAFGVTGVDFQLEPMRLVIDEVKAEKPLIRLTIDADGKLNLTELMKKEVGASDPEPAAATPSKDESAQATTLPDVTVKKIVVAGGEFEFVDGAISPAVAHRIENLELNLENLSLQDQGLATLEVKAALGSGARLKVGGKMRPNPFLLDAKVDLIGFQLPAMSPYSGKFIGWELAQGTLMLDLHHKIDGTKLDLENKVVLDELELGGKVDSKDAVKVPLKLALPLLKDINGQMSIPLPVRGDLNDPDFKIAKIVIQTFVNLITKAAASPFKLLGSLAGSEANLEEAVFTPGAVELEDAALASLQPLSQALAKRPTLKLLVTGEIGGGDEAAIRTGKFEALLRGQKAKQLIEAGETVDDPATIEIADSERQSLMAAAYEAADLPELGPLPALAGGATDEEKAVAAKAAEARAAEMRAAVLATVAVEEKDLIELATTRAEAVQAWLIENGIAEDRVFIGQMVTEEAEGKAPRVRFAPK